MEDPLDPDCPPAKVSTGRAFEWELFQLLEQVPVGIFVATAAGKPYYANFNARRLLYIGNVPEHVNQFSDAFRLFESGTDRPYPGERLPIVRALAGESCQISDVELRREDGTIVQLHMSGAPMRLRGETAFAVTAIQDVGELRRLATTDALTGLPNRTAAVETFARERLLADRHGTSLAVALIDFDGFKGINDTHGHAKGDEVLRRGTAAITGALRATDLVARWGGEELVAVFPRTDAAGAGNAIESALAVLRELDFAGASDAAFRVTFSAGVVDAMPGEPLDEVIKRADALLYEAKRTGRNRVLSVPGASKI